MIDEPDPDVLLHAMGRCLTDSVAPGLMGAGRERPLFTVIRCR